MTSTLLLALALLVGPEGRGALLADGNLTDAATGRTLATGVDSAAFTSDGVLWAVAGGKLGWIDDGKLVTSIDLPGRGCRLAASADATAARLVIACPHGDAQDDLFVLEADAGYRYLMTTDSIDALAVTRAGLLIASDGAIVHYRPGSPGIVEPVAAVPGEIAALCVDSAEPVLYLLAAGRVTALVDGRSVALADGIADLACAGGDLHLLQADGTARTVTGAGRALAGKAREEGSP